MTTLHHRIKFSSQIRCLLLASIATLVSATAAAQIVSFRFTGTANFVGSSLTPYFAVGDSFTYTLSYDTSTVGTYAGDFSRSFEATSAVFSVAATGGSWTTSITAPQIQIDDEASFSRFTVLSNNSISNPSVDGKSVFNIQLGLYSDDMNMITGFSLPSDLSLSGWSTSPSSSGVFTYWESGTSPYFMRFSFNSVEKLSAVPEPSSYALLSGLFVLAGVACRRRHVRDSTCH